MGRKPLTSEQKAKISASLRGRTFSEQHRAALSAALRASEAFKEACAKNHALAHESRRGAKLSAEHLAIVRTNNLGRKFGPEARARMSEAAKRRGPRTEAHRQAMSVAMKSSPKASAQRSRIYLANPSSIERIVHCVLDALGVTYTTQYRIGRFIADIFVPSHRLVVECDGSYWHRHRADADAVRDEYMRGLGYKVLRLSEGDIRAGKSKEQLTQFIVTAAAG